MRKSTRQPAPVSEADPVLDRLVDEVARKLQAGEPIDLEIIRQREPERAELLRKILPSMEMLVNLGKSMIREAAAAENVPAGAPGGHPPGVTFGTLGDFRIERELGRGGMGVVFLAQQISLARRVALKVLPLAAALEPRQLARFQLESQAAALLQHPGIVPVYAVGCERGMHYYAMQFIEGPSLAAVIRNLRHRIADEAPTASAEPPHVRHASDPADAIADELVSGLFAEPSWPGPGPNAESSACHVSSSDLAADQAGRAGGGSRPGAAHGPPYFTAVAH